MCPYIVGIVLNSHKQAHPVKLFHDLPSRLIAVQPPVFAAVFSYCCIIIHNIDFRQIVTFPHFEIVGVMGGRDFDYSGTELHIHIRIPYDGNLSVHNRQHNLSPDQRPVSVIIGVHSHSRIPQHRLGTGGGKFQKL